MLRVAYEMRALVVLFDGIDEAPHLREQLEDFVIDVLAPAGVRCVVTSRAEGVSLERYTRHFAILELEPLSDEQQRATVDIQLNAFEVTRRLVAARALRDEHDRLAESVITPTERTTLRPWAAYRAARPARDVDQRQRTVDGARWPRHARRSAAGRAFMNRLSTGSPQFLKQLDAAVGRRGGAVVARAAAQRSQQLEDLFEPRASPRPADAGTAPRG